MQPFTKRLVELLPNQFHSKAVQVDGFLRVKGAPAGTVYALGDASTVCTPAEIEAQLTSDPQRHASASS